MIRLVILPILCLFSCQPTYSKTYNITFKVAVDESDTLKTVSLRGSIKPLTWSEDYPMADHDGDGVYETTISFNTKDRNVQYKFVVDGSEELLGNDNRRHWFKENKHTTSHTFNEYEYYNEEEIAKNILTQEQIKEDIAVLKKTLIYIHPDLYAYRSKAELEKDFEILESKILATPTIINTYKAISEFIAKIKCSHTFTNPWNQGTRIKKSIFFQPDKIPFTFSRIGMQIFIDKNASANERLKKGTEVVKINGIEAEVILTQLAKHIASDGDNYEKRLERLNVRGDEKFALFDIFYTLEYGIQDSFKLDLKDHTTDKTFSTMVKAISKTKRSKILQDRYQDQARKFEDNWEFKMISKEIALLKINSFAVYNKGFDWQEFLKNVFTQMNANSAKYFIIDIRNNEGGDNDVVKYILEHIVNEPIKMAAPKNITAYRKIPDDIKAHISTWDNKPYNWKLKVKKIGSRKYQLREIIAGGARTYQPKENGFKGKSYLLTGPQNSSATHIMATYVKKYNLATIIGQTTGGNQRGVNGGYIFFNRLPHSKVEVDIPVIKTTINEVTNTTPNGGIVPDILIDKKIQDLINGIDTELEATLKLIRDNQ